MTTAARLVCVLILVGGVTTVLRCLPELHRRGLARVHGAHDEPGLSWQPRPCSRRPVPRQRAHR